MLKLVVYKKKACIYLIGGTKEPVITLNKSETAYEISMELVFKINQYFWDRYEGIYYKGKLYSIETIHETALKIEELLKEKQK